MIWVFRNLGYVLGDGLDGNIMRRVLLFWCFVCFIGLVVIYMLIELLCGFFGFCVGGFYFVIFVCCYVSNIVMKI